MKQKNLVLPKQTIIHTDSNPIGESSDHIQQADTGSKIAIKAHQTDDRPIESYEVAQDATAAEQTNAVPKLPTNLTKEALAALDKYFLNREFDFEKFAKINGIQVDPNCKPDPEIIKSSFKRMHFVVKKLLDSPITINKHKNDSVTIELTANEIISAYKNIESLDTNDEHNAYAFYGKLGNIIFNQLLYAGQKQFFNTKISNLKKCFTSGCDLYTSILSLPLVSFSNGMNLCAIMLNTTLGGYGYRHYKIAEQLLFSDYQSQTSHQELANEFKKFGMFFAFESEHFARQVLQAAKFAIYIGMKTPLFVAEIISDKSTVGGFSHEIIGVCLDSIATNQSMELTNNYDHNETITIQMSHHNFYHECIHHVRTEVGTLFLDESIKRKSLPALLTDDHDIIDVISFQQLRPYALTNSEEYIADFGAFVLCILEQNKNPFDYIPDKRLWQLFYEFGGPDFAQTINEKNNSRSDCPKYDILEDSDHCYEHLSGYPSKFGIDINQIKDQQVVVEGLVAIEKKSNVAIDEKTILPPPPLGYCYEVKDQKLKLKDVASEAYYDPIFCSLTDGPLTLMYAEDISDPENPKPLQHHFEVLPTKTNNESQPIDTSTSSSTNNTSNNAISTIISAAGSIIKFPLTTVKFAINWVRFHKQNVL